MSTSKNAGHQESVSCLRCNFSQNCSKHFVYEVRFLINQFLFAFFTLLNFTIFYNEFINTSWLLYYWTLTKQQHKQVALLFCFVLILILKYRIIGIFILACLNVHILNALDFHIVCEMPGNAIPNTSRHAFNNIIIEIDICYISQILNAERAWMPPILEQNILILQALTSHAI